MKSKKRAPRNSEEIDNKMTTDKQDPLQEMDIDRNSLISVQYEKQVQTDGQVVIENGGFEVYIKQEPVGEIDSDRDVLPEEIEEVAIKKEPLEEKMFFEIEVSMGEDISEVEIGRTENIISKENRDSAPTEKCSIAEIRPYECQVCQERFSFRSTLDEHSIIHTGEKPFECEICRQKFSLRSHLSRHLNKHTGEKPFECEVCQQRFAVKDSLMRHMTTHTGEKPYECDICYQRFAARYTLSTHLRTHTGEKPFECEICLQRFTVKVSLNRHFKKHTEHPFQCDICRRRFKEAFELDMHLGLSEHGNTSGVSVISTLCPGKQLNNLKSEDENVESDVPTDA